MEQLNYLNDKSNQLYSDIHNVYKVPSNEQTKYLNDVNNTFLCELDKFNANQRSSYRFPSCLNNNIGISSFKLRDSYSSFEINNHYKNSFETNNCYQPQLKDYTQLRSFSKYSYIPPRAEFIKCGKNVRNNALLKDLINRNEFCTKKNNDVHHFYTCSVPKKHVTARSIREFLTSWKDSDDDDTINSGNHLNKTKLIKKSQLLNRKSKKLNFSLQSSFKNLCNRITKISLQQLISILRTNKSISFASYLIKKYKNQMKCVNKNQTIKINTIKAICRHFKNIKKPEKKNFQILNYFINKLKKYNKKPLTLFKICKRFLKHNYNLKVISKLSNYCTTVFNKVIVILQDNHNDFPGLEPVCYFTEVTDETSAWFRKNLLREKYKNKILVNKNRKLEKQLKNSKC